jgi:hypothetical protein
MGSESPAALFHDTGEISTELLEIGAASGRIRRGSHGDASYRKLGTCRLGFTI